MDINRVKTDYEKYRDTIAAISTPPGEGGIGIVRMSGPLSLSIMEKLFVPANIEISNTFSYAPRHAYFGYFNDNSGNLIDDVICLYLKAPHTYTREDMVEIQAHGSPVSLRLILKALLSAGCRLAEPGEFTKLAFMNGRIDLSQAEAVMDLISAKTDTPHGIALKQLSGKLKEEIEEIRDKLRNVLAQITVNIDFPDEDIEQREYVHLISELKSVKDKVEKIAITSETGRIARDGVKVAIVGRPNVGKSSLMNGILGEDRAIVTNIPGTTRDTIEEQANFQGIPIILTDTAGIRESDDVVEKIGIDRAKTHIESTDIVLFVIDGSEELREEDFAIIDLINKVKDGTGNSKKIIVVINKSDLPQRITDEDISHLTPYSVIIHTSLIKFDGAETVVKEIGKLVNNGTVISEMGNIITNERHTSALNRAIVELKEAINGLEINDALEMIEIPAHAAYDSLGEIIGEAAGDEILDAVFTKFCLGK